MRLARIEAAPSPEFLLPTLAWITVGLVQIYQHRWVRGQPARNGYSLRLKMADLHRKQSHARSVSAKVLSAIKDSAVEYVVLFGLWMLFVSMTKPQEMIAGLIAAAIAAVADATIKSEGFAKFKPRIDWLPLIFWEAWYALDGTWAIMVALFRHIAGKKSEAQFVSVPMITGGDDAESWARRALMVAYITMTPNVIVLGIDIEGQRMLLHEILPTGVPLIAQRLGAKTTGLEEAPQA